MNDGTPEDVASDAQLDRIRRSVLRRIADRRRIRRQVVGGAVAVVLVVGGFGGLLRLAGGSASGGSAAGSAAESTASGIVSVACATGSGAREGRVRVPEAKLPGAAIEACGAAVDFQSSTGRMPTAAPTASSTAAPSGALTGGSYSPSRTPAVLCRAANGALTVLPLTVSAAATCARAGLHVWRSPS